MVFPLFLALATLQYGFCGKWSVHYDTTSLPVKYPCVTIRCSYSYPTGHRVTATIWSATTDYSDHGEVIVYHSQEDLINYHFKGRTRFLGDENSDCSLRIDDLKVTDEGHYHFKLETDMHTFSSPRYFVQLFPRPRCDLNIFLPEELKEGKKAVLICSGQGCRYNTVLKWHNSNGEVITEGTWSSDPARSTSLNITPSWQDHGRVMRCMSSVKEDRYRNTCAITSTTELHVKYSPKGTQAVMSLPPKGWMEAGDTVSLRCKVNTSNPAVSSYTWYKDGSELLSQSQGSLRMDNVTAADSGSYSCVAHNVIGSSLSSPPVLVRVTDGVLSSTEFSGGLVIGIAVTVVAAIVITVAVATWRYLKNKKTSNAANSTELSLESGRAGGTGFYENVVTVYAALDTSQISPEYVEIRRLDRRMGRRANR